MSRPNLAAPGEVRTLRIGLLRPSALNPRKRFDADKAAELTASIRTFGVLQPLLVREITDGLVYEIVAGERRYHAACAAGLDEVPVVVREMDDATAVEAAMSENVLRDSLTPLEEADGFAALVRCGRTQEQIAARVGKSRGYVANRLAIAHAGEAVRTALADGRIGASVALIFARLPEAAQAEAVNHCETRPTIERALSIAQASARMLANAPFGIDDPSLSPADGICSDCPRRTGAERGLFGTDDDDLCLDGECWRRKCGVQFVRTAAEHRGLVLGTDEAAKVFGNYGVEHDSNYSSLEDERDYLADDAKAAAALEKLPVILAQNPITGTAEKLVERAKVDAIRRKHLERPAKPAAAPKVTEAQRAAEAERKRCEAVGEALVLAAIGDRKNAAAVLVALGTHDFQNDYSIGVLAVAGLTKKSSLDAWARKCSKDDLASFLLAARLEGEYCANPDAVRNLAARLDLPVPEGFAEAPKAKAGKRGAK